MSGKSANESDVSTSSTSSSSSSSSSSESSISDDEYSNKVEQISKHDENVSSINNSMPKQQIHDTPLLDVCEDEKCLVRSNQQKVFHRDSDTLIDNVSDGSTCKCDEKMQVTKISEETSKPKKKKGSLFSFFPFNIVGMSMNVF